jgi:hypothetical protein
VKRNPPLISTSKNSKNKLRAVHRQHWHHYFQKMFQTERPSKKLSPLRPAVGWLVLFGCLWSSEADNWRSLAWDLAGGWLRPLALPTVRVQTLLLRRQQTCLLNKHLALVVRQTAPRFTQQHAYRSERVIIFTINDKITK